MWRALIHLLDEASQDPADTHGWTAEERALAREAVAWYRQQLGPSAIAAYQGERRRLGTLSARRRAGELLRARRSARR